MFESFVFKYIACPSAFIIPTKLPVSYVQKFPKGIIQTNANVFLLILYKYIDRLCHAEYIIIPN